MNGLKRNDEDICRRVANICGLSSGAAKALFELERRREEGENVEVVAIRNVWLVRACLPGKETQDT